jgi:pimeloyl-ACP methyl ester carboxylesterase
MIRQIRMRIILFAVLLFFSYLQVQANTVDDTPKSNLTKTVPLLMTKYMYKQYKADKGTVSVPENRNIPGSRMIELPVVRIFSTSQKPVEPVFLFFGGPGASNIWLRPPLWLLKHHDLVMVGYRGVDGSVSLNSPEFIGLLKVKNPLSPSNFKKIGETAFSVFQRLKKEGIDIDGYNIVEVIDDMETVRKILGYEKINIYGGSFGTIYANIYGYRYPNSIHRRVMADVGIPGHQLGRGDMVEKYIKKLAEIWKKDPQRAAKMPNPLETFKKVLENSSLKLKGREIDRDKLKLVILRLLYSRKGMTMMFNAFAAAGNGDFTGLALLENMFDGLVEKVNWGEGLSKKLCQISRSKAPKEKQLKGQDMVLASPYEKIWYGLRDKWPIKTIPQKYLSLQPSEVETLMISASIDFSTPLEYAKELLPYLSKGHHVVLAERGHQDVGRLQPAAYEHLVEQFYLKGIVDDSQFKYIPMDFSEIPTG